MNTVPYFPLMIVLIVVARRKILIDKFRKTNTTTANAAKTLDELNVSRRLMFNRLIMRGAIVEVNGKYYLDEQNLRWAT